MLQVYLAGPEVFLLDGLALVQQKREICAEYGFRPTRPQGDFMDIDKRDANAFGQEISRVNEELMNEADLCIANITPFRGISADVGTVFEIGYMIAQDKPTFGYTNDPREYSTRATNDFYGYEEKKEGALTSPDGQRIENHGMVDNLMIDGGLDRRGRPVVRAETMPSDLWRDLGTFRRALVLAREQLLPGFRP